jgi:hypothetical protein
MWKNRTCRSKAPSIPGVLSDHIQTYYHRIKSFLYLLGAGGERAAVDPSMLHSRLHPAGKKVQWANDRAPTTESEDELKNVARQSLNTTAKLLVLPSEVKLRERIVKFVSDIYTKLSNKYLNFSSLFKIPIPQHVRYVSIKLDIL